MEIAQTAWEKKERASLLALLTEKGQERQRIAENPETTGDVLEQIARDIDRSLIADSDPQYEYSEVSLIMGTILAHPNTPPLWSRSPLDLLEHLARSGNRLVRWAAQTRLADPDFTFTQDDEKG